MLRKKPKAASASVCSARDDDDDDEDATDAARLQIAVRTGPQAREPRTPVVVVLRHLFVVIWH